MVPNLPIYQSVTFLANICATEDEILISMCSVDISKASGSDGIGNKMIKLCSESLYLFFSKFVNFSFALGSTRLRGKWLMLFLYLKKVTHN